MRDPLEYLNDVLQAGRFDLIAATDVFVYVGDLLPVFRQASRILQPGRWLAFPLESAADGDKKFVLGSSRRYQHSRAYIERLCTEFKLEIRRFSEATIRQDKQPADSRVYLAA